MRKKYLIVGQGLAGSVLAFKMYQQGIDFKVIASQDISKASDVAAGLFNPMVFKRLTKSWMVDACLPDMLETYRAMEALLKGQFLFKKEMIKPVSEQESLLWKEKIGLDNFSDYLQGIYENPPISGMHPFHAFGKVMQSGSLRLNQMLSEFRLWLKSRDALIDQRFEYEDLEITECLSCHRPATKKDLVTWRCDECNQLGEIIRLEKIKRILKCPECRNDLIEESRKEIFICEFCAYKSFLSEFRSRG